MKKLFLAGCLALAVFSPLASAQTRYVSDELVITFRTGPGSQFAIERNLTSGDRVEILEEQVEEGYARVRLPDGAEGWVLTRYLQPGPTAELRLAAASRELTAAEQRVAELEQRVGELEANLATTSETLNATQTNAEAMNAELSDIRSASASALQTRRQNEQLRQRVDELTSAAQIAEMEIDELRQRERQNWFVIGAAVLFGGIVIGLIAPSLRRKRRSSW